MLSLVLQEGILVPEILRRDVKSGHLEIQN
jgi:hypothetical protein